MADTVGKGKKRKRHTDGSSRQSKEVAIERDQNVKISLRDGDKWAPIIASTSGVILPTSISLKAYTKPRRNAPPKSARGGLIANTEVHLQSSAHPKLDYTAREEEAGGLDTLLRHYVGVFDPETGKLEVMEARKMVVRGVVRSQQATPEDQFHTNMRDLRNNLGQAFGTKKAKKAIVSFTENAIALGKVTGEKAPKLDAVAAATIASMAKDTEGMATREQLQVEADAAKPRPKANMEAEDIKDVYTIESLIGLDMVKHIPVMDWQQALKSKKKDNQVVVKSRYVASRLLKVSTNVEKLKILRYLNLLLDLHINSRTQRGGVKMLPKRDVLKTALGGMPEAVVESAKRKFSTGGTMSKYQVDLLITHVCALAFLVDDFELEISELKDDFKIEIKEMVQYFKEIGAKVAGKLPEAYRKAMSLDKARASQYKVAKLKLPLEFPKVAFARRG